MRLVEVMIPAGKREAVLKTLDDEGIDYALTDETSGREYTAVVSFPLPRNAVEPILERLREIGIDEDSYTIVIDAQTVISRRFDELQEQYNDTNESDQRIAREEIQSEAADLMPNVRTYLTLAIVSAVVATAGLLLDSPAVVVGSMVIAPVLGPAMATSVGTVINDNDLFRQGVKFQVVGFTAATIAATVFALLVKSLYLVPPGLDVLELGQVQGRLSPDLLSLAVALGGGIAGAMSLSGGVSAALVGVMIAAALIPPVAAVGIGIAWGLSDVVLGAGVLVLVNLFSINLAALVVLWYMGYRPGKWFEADEARSKTVRRIGMLLVGLLLLSGFLAGVTLTSFQTATSDQAVRDEVNAVLSDEEYANLSLIDVEITREGGPLGSQTDQVVITVGRPGDENHPGLASRIVERVRDTTGQNVSVQVQLVTVQTAGGSSERVAEPVRAAERSPFARARDKHGGAHSSAVPGQTVT
ncbi:TIGR00341 family protein [Halostella pelagica]|uniref:TIGR00341 family protein n=1 Tax=Halostella pelagica TaxID=2583824 RepID=UPI0010800555|nr:TIGR00341 family protein [Halostella pelagica]